MALVEANNSRATRWLQKKERMKRKRVSKKSIGKKTAIRSKSRVSNRTARGSGEIHTAETLLESSAFDATKLPLGAYPPILGFIIAYCSAAEGRTVGEGEHLKNLANVRIPFLNAAINRTYHDRAGVVRYPGNRPSKELSVRGAAIDVKNDLTSKGINVPL